MEAAMVLPSTPFQLYPSIEAKDLQPAFHSDINKSSFLSTIPLPMSFTDAGLSLELFGGCSLSPEKYKDLTRTTQGQQEQAEF